MTAWADLLDPDKAARIDWRRFAFWSAILIGGIVRFYALGRVPAGLNSDEASTGVEALSIVQTGMDRWGNHLPVWFPAWGSGMNALYTYLAVPVVAVFGLNVVALRAIGALFGLLTLPVAYYAARIHFDRSVALATLWLVAILPWGVMSSRWALDSNLVPFWFTLGLLTIGKAMHAKDRKWPALALLPWALCVYAYPISLIPITASGLLISWFYREELSRNLAPWVAGAALAFIFDLPFLLFLVKNEFGIARLPFESFLPFSIPSLPASRLHQISQSLPRTLYDNLVFIWSGYRDGLVWHQSGLFLPLTGAAPYLTLLGIAALAVGRSPPRPPNIVLLVALTAMVPVCLIPLNLTRLNWFYVPSLMIISHLVVNVGILDFAAKYGLTAVRASVVYVFVLTSLFYPYYFRSYNDEILVEDLNLQNGFRVGLQDSLKLAAARANSDEPIFVDVGTVHPYLYVLFFGLSDIRTFQATRRVRIDNGVYRVSRFGRFMFERNALDTAEPASFAFVSRSNRIPCPAPEVFSSDTLWTAGRCRAS